jgi:alkyl sulfatase BDS1-like metallo-beta-lactamase superfamily hydrolase
MPHLGSPAWIDALATSAAALDAGGVELVVRHQIQEGPSWLLVADGRHVTARAADDEHPAADVTFTWQADDAAAVVAGTTTVLAVFQTGRLQVGGDLRRLADATALFARFPGAAG